MDSGSKLGKHLVNWVGRNYRRIQLQWGLKIQPSNWKTTFKKSYKFCIFYDVLKPDICLKNPLLK